MTERAREREEYKREFRKPAPEYRHTRKRKRDKPFVVEARMRADFAKRFTCLNDDHWTKSWHRHDRYATLADAEKAVEMLNRKDYMYEYRMGEEET